MIGYSISLKRKNDISSGVEYDPKVIIKVFLMEQGKPNSLLLERRDESDFIYRLVGKDSAKSESLAVMTRIGFLICTERWLTCIRVLLSNPKKGKR